jgi:tripartite-type tricarboxylate transporter receptor subunit TctC
MQTKVIQDRLALDAIETKLMSAEEYTKFVQAETTRWAPVAKSLSAIVAKE